MMERIPFALTGYLDTAAVPGDAVDTAAWRLISSPADCEAEEEAIIPCTTSRPDLAHKLLTDCQPGDLLRVTGSLALPDTADGRIRLDVDHVEALWEAPLLDPDVEADDTDTVTTTDTEHSNAITALAEALYELTRNSPGLTIGIQISPNGPLSSASEHAHILDISPALAHQLADHVNALSRHLHSQRPDDTVVDQQTIAELTDYFHELDLTELTRDVLNAARPEDRVAVTRALDDLFGDIPVTGIDDSDQ